MRDKALKKKLQQLHIPQYDEYKLEKVTQFSGYTKNIQSFSCLDFYGSADPYFLPLYVHQNISFMIVYQFRKYNSQCIFIRRPFYKKQNNFFSH